LGKPQLSAAATLDLWQEAEGRDPVGRSLALAAVSGRPPDELAALPIGQRDALLLELHAEDALEATAVCPACGEQAEFSVETAALLARAGDARPGRWRPPDSADVAAAAAAGSTEAAERVLLERCAGSAELAPDERAAVAAAIAEADPLAEVLVDVSCPACGAEFVADLDVGTFVWADVRARAGRLLLEVAALARAYGWTETEVLALGERRRAAYLELAEARA
jgi:hypothetical protein